MYMLMSVAHAAARCLISTTSQKHDISVSVIALKPMAVLLS